MDGMVVLPRDEGGLDRGMHFHPERLANAVQPPV